MRRLPRHNETESPLTVFGKTLHFVDPEPVSRTNPIPQGSWIVLESPDLIPERDFPLHSGWSEHSGRMVRYHSTRPFGKERNRFPWCLEVHGVLTLVRDPDRNAILYRRGEAFSPERLRFWILHTFIPLTLELEESCHILHMGGVEAEGRALLFAAPSYGGKSTLTDRFLRRGHPLLADDALGIFHDSDTGTWNALPSYPFHRPFRQSETLGVRTTMFRESPLPIGAIYVLDRRREIRKPRLSELRGVEKFEALRQSCFVDFDFMEERRLDFLGPLARKVPIFRLGYPDDIEALPEVYDTLVSDFRTLS